MLGCVQVFKSMADVASGEALYNKYSEVSEEEGGWLSLRDTVLARKMPRRMLVQPLTVIQGKVTSQSQYWYCKLAWLLYNNYYKTSRGASLLIVGVVKLG